MADAFRPAAKSAPPVVAEAFRPATKSAPPVVVSDSFWPAAEESADSAMEAALAATAFHQPEAAAAAQAPAFGV